MENSERVWKMGGAGDWPATRPPTGLAERGHEGSRGLQSTEGWVLWLRVAERRLNGTGPFHRSAVAPRRRIVCLAAVRGLKPTATIVVSLRETYRKCPRPADQNGGEPRCKRPFSLLDLKPDLVPSGESRDGTGGPAGRLCYPDQHRVQFAIRARRRRLVQQHSQRGESLHQSHHRPPTFFRLKGN